MTQGRPSDYTPEIAAKFCLAVATSLLSIEHICASDDDFPDEKTIFTWMHQNPSFRKEYLVAKETQGVNFAEHILHTAAENACTSDDVARVNLIFRVGQWHYSKLAPKLFGEERILNMPKFKKCKTAAERIDVLCEYVADGKIATQDIGAVSNVILAGVRVEEQEELKKRLQSLEDKLQGVA